MRQLMAVGKLLRVLAWAIYGYWLVRVTFRPFTEAQRSRAIEAWATEMLRRMGIALQLQGQAATGPVLMAANHISWLDILVMDAASHCRFIAKAEIGGWPLVGALAVGSGSLFIERRSKSDAKRVVQHMAAALRQGHVLAVFPEGSTGDGLQLRPFHASLFQSAIDADVPVQPVALQFIDARTHAPSFAPCYGDDESLLHSVWRTLCAPPLVAQVRYGPVQTAHGRSRRLWAQDLQTAVADLRR